MRISKRQFQLLFQLVNYSLIPARVGFVTQYYSGYGSYTEFLCYQNESDKCFIIPIDQVNSSDVNEVNWEQYSFECQTFLDGILSLVEKEIIVLPAILKYKNYRFSLFNNDQVVCIHPDSPQGLPILQWLQFVPCDLRQHIVHNVLNQEYSSI